MLLWRTDFNQSPKRVNPTKWAKFGWHNVDWVIYPNYLHSSIDWDSALEIFPCWNWKKKTFQGTTQWTITCTSIAEFLMILLYVMWQCWWLSRDADDELQTSKCIIIMFIQFYLFVNPVKLIRWFLSFRFIRIKNKYNMYNKLVWLLEAFKMLIVRDKWLEPVYQSYLWDKKQWILMHIWWFDV